MDTHTHTHTHTQALTRSQTKQFQEARRALAAGRRAPGLKNKFSKPYELKKEVEINLHTKSRKTRAVNANPTLALHS